MVSNSMAGKKRSASRSTVPRDTTYMEAEVIVFARGQAPAALNPPLPLRLLRLQAECARFSSRPSAYPRHSTPHTRPLSEGSCSIQVIPPVILEPHTTTKSCACLRR
jgi:hypothetical protein